MQLDLFDPKIDFEYIKVIWQKLTEHQTISYFLSWGWVENWLDLLPSDSSVKLAVINKNDKPIAAFFLGAAKTVRKKVIHTQQLHLNATGMLEYDLLAIEHNGILLAKGVNLSLKELLELLPGEWDEFLFPALDTNSFPGNNLTIPSVSYKIVNRYVVSRFIDLSLVRQRDNDLTTLLKKKTRVNIRRSFNLYKKHYGPIHLEAASTIKEALEILNEISHFNKQRFEGSKIISSFHNDFFVNFHTSLIRKRFDQDDMQLLRIVSGDTLIGSLYSFIFHGHVCQYQGGFNFDVDNRLQPGLVCHTEAVRHNAQQGHLVYDLMAGDYEYKKRIATSEYSSNWAKIQKKHFKFLIEEQLIRMKDYFDKDQKSITS